MKDMFNNTPLLLACVYDYENRYEDQIKTIEILLKKKAQPNVQNKFSGFTPLHWLARYGKIEAVKMLLEDTNAKEYIPDNRGFRPIDYAGKFNHQEVILKLIDWSLKKIENSDKEYVIADI